MAGLLFERPYFTASVKYLTLLKSRVHNCVRKCVHLEFPAVSGIAPQLGGIRLSETDLALFVSQPRALSCSLAYAVINICKNSDLR